MYVFTYSIYKVEPLLLIDIKDALPLAKDAPFLLFLIRSYPYTYFLLSAALYSYIIALSIYITFLPY